MNERRPSLRLSEETEALAVAVRSNGQLGMSAELACSVALPSITTYFCGMGSAGLELKPGAVALVDALGFKGIWKRSDVGTLLETLHRCRLRMLARRDRFETQQGSERNISVNIGVFSDNVIAAAHSDGPDSTSDDLAACVQVVAAMVADLQIAALETSVRLAFRGCIATGDIFADEHFVVGEAVDRAAEHMELADGAFVWCLPDERYQIPSEESFHILVDYEVPLRDGRRFATQVVNPFAAVVQHVRISKELAKSEVLSQSLGNARKDLERLLLKTFKTATPSPDVRIKQQNTEAFLKAIAKAIEL